MGDRRHPPLVEAAWHEGKISSPEYLPHFSNPTLGTLLEEACEKHLISQLTVLCGHTHSGGRVVKGNLTVFTAPAVYSQPKIESVIRID